MKNKTISIEGGIYFNPKNAQRYEWEADEPFKFFGGKFQGFGEYIPVQTFTIVATVPDRDYTVDIIRGMEAQIAEINLQAHHATQALRNQISKLQCIEMTEVA